MNGTEPQRETVQGIVRAATTETVETVEAPGQTSPSPKCTFSRVVATDLKRFADSGVALVECPDCSRTRSRSSHKGALRFPLHDQRKMQTPVTGVRWAAKSKTDWDVVGG